MYKMYRKILDKRYEDESNREYYEELRVIIENAEPEFKSQYDSETLMQKSFTQEQQDFICWQIGEWYLHWKHQIVVEGNSGAHRLGYAKEMLKSMICGDGYD